MEGYEVSI